MTRIHLIIFGDVQGVGFRAWVQRMAQSMQLTGWVKNRKDGTVELVAEGSEESLKKMFKLCRKGPDIAGIENIQSTWQEKPQEFLAFEIIR